MLTGARSVRHVELHCWPAGAVASVPLFRCTRAEAGAGKPTVPAVPRDLSLVKSVRRLHHAR
jgi:hypothetical protein